MKLLQKIPPEIAQAALLTTIADQYKSSLFATAKHLLGYKDITKNTHLGMIHALESQKRRKLIVMPRGTFKSSIACVAFPIWLLMRDPNERILIDSEVYSNSKNFLREIAAHLESPKLTKLFGPWKGGTWNEGEITVSQRTKIYKEASITCGGIGTIKVGQHYSWIIMDDLNSNNNSQTSEGRKKVTDHYRMNTAILEPNGGIALIGTRYATDDCLGFVMENEIDRKGLL
jgi:hypothetical protein